MVVLIVFDRALYAPEAILNQMEWLWSNNQLQLLEKMFVVTEFSLHRATRLNVDCQTFMLEQQICLPELQGNQKKKH